MNYFESLYASFSYPVETSNNPGFRPAQIAAIQAVNAHLYSRPGQPAVVVMPTGSGKTTIINALCFTQRARRALIITPSRLVREQIAEGFQSLDDLIKIGALPLSAPKPNVLSTQSRLQTITDWELLRDYDVVVATVPSINSHIDDAAPIPSDLFDLVLVDEAHHSPARTWSQVLRLCGQAKQVLFTATPFRRDEKEIKGRFVFSYDLRRAHQDGVFGDIRFVPITSDADDLDVKIAKQVQSQLSSDRQAGHDHLVMVRTDSIKRATELKTVYENSTSLRLALVKGSHGLRHVRSVVEKLRNRELDGIICVNMFGEGFNLPQLKIAAIHSPHRSLAVTLQFIGRFARTTASNIGSATFIAAPQKSSDELEGLYEAGSIWKDIVSNLSESRITSELQLREVLESFEIDAHPDLDDMSMYTLCPYFHVKVFFASSEADLSQKPDFPERLELIFDGQSSEHGATVYLTRETLRCPWSKDERFNNIAYDLFIFHINREAGLLFICSSRRNAKLYDRLATPILNEHPQALAHSEINRALNELEAAEFFSVGMRKRHRLGQTESYRMLTGPNADRAIQEADGRFFDRGHCFGKGLLDGQEITLGVSSASKVWSNTYGQIPVLLEWCDQIAKRINSGRDPKTGSRLDHLGVGERLAQVPGGVIAMAYSRETYLDPAILEYVDADGEVHKISILDCDCRITASEVGAVAFQLSCNAFQWNGVFRIGQGVLIQSQSDNEPTITVYPSGDSLDDFFNEELPTFYCKDMAAIEGVTLYRSHANLEPISQERFEAVDWQGASVDIRKEKPNGQTPISLFEWLQTRLTTTYPIVFCDDGTGETADYIAISQLEQKILVQLYHCKGSGAPTSGNRVDDLYEVCGQAVKSSVWFRQEILMDRIEKRSALPSVRGFVKGTLDDAKSILCRESRQQIDFEVYIVQPGIKVQGRSEAISNLLASAAIYLHDGGASNFGIICSA